MNISVYMDETGPNDISGVVPGKLEWAGVGGCISTVERWTKFEVEWRQVSVRPFHFSEFSDKLNGPKKSDWPYTGWSEDKRSAFLFGLAKIVNEYTIRSAAALVHLPSYFRELPDWYREHLKSPYALCLEYYLKEILSDVRKHSFLSLQKQPDKFLPAAFHFDHVSKRNVWHDSIFRVFRALINGCDETLFGELIVAEKGGKGVPLEAADLVLYSMRQVEQRFCEGYNRPLDEVLSAKLTIRPLNGEFLRDLAVQVEQNKDKILSAPLTARP